MRKFEKLLLACMVLSFVFVLTSCKSAEQKSDLKIGLVIDVSGIDDKSFNQSAWEGILRFADEYGLPSSNYSYTHSMSEKEYVPNLSSYADQNYDLTIALGYYCIEPLKTVAPKYPDRKFLILDATVDKPNVASVTFASHEGAYLVGVLTGLKAKEEGYDTVGFLGGYDIVTVNEFEAGFIAGIKEVNEDLNILVEYANDFANPLYGMELADKMYSKGAKIIFNVAGGTGNGLIDEAKQRALKGEDVWVIGVDKDQYSDGIFEPEKSVILTSLMKNVELAAYDVIKAVQNDEFVAKHYFYSLKNNGVKIPDTNPNLKEEWIEKMNAYKNKIIDGEIEVPSVPERLKKEN